MALEELKKKVLSEVTGLEDWEVEVGDYSLKMRLYDSAIEHFNSFGISSAPVDIYPSSQEGKKWETSVHWRTDIRSAKYKTDSGLLKRLQLIVNKGNETLAQDRARHTKHVIGVADLTKKLVPYVEEYGDIFKVGGPDNVRMDYAGFTGKVDLAQEAVDLSNDVWCPNYVPMHMAIPFMREVELFRLLE